MSVTRTTGLLPLQDPFDPQPSGNLIFNNNSYSGADIKAIVHVYDQKPDPGQDPRVLQEQRILRGFEETLASTRTQIAAIQGFSPASRASAQERLSQLTLTQAALEELINRQKASIGQALIESRESTDVATKVLAEIQTLSVSTFREKQPVRALGSVYPRGFTRASRTIAGSMIFTVFDRNVLSTILRADLSDLSGEVTTALIDQLPPFDVTIAFANEYGHVSRMAILGCEFVSEGQVMSVEDMITENQSQFVARDIDPMRPDGAPRPLESAAEAGRGAQSASDLLNSDALYKAYRDSANPWVKTRRNRFI